MSDGKKVWLVEHGEYSDYTVDGVFSSEENAKMFAEQANIRRDGSYNRREVREVFLDPFIPMLRKGMKCWLVRMWRDGRSTVESTEPSGDDSYSFTSNFYPDSHIIAEVWAKDQAGAAKIVNEYRAREIATGRWAVASE